MKRNLTCSRGFGATTVNPGFGDLALSNRGGLLNPDIALYGGPELSFLRLVQEE